MVVTRSGSKKLAGAGGKRAASPFRMPRIIDGPIYFAAHFEKYAGAAMIHSVAKCNVVSHEFVRRCNLPLVPLPSRKSVDVEGQGGQKAAPRHYVRGVFSYQRDDGRYFNHKQKFLVAAPGKLPIADLVLGTPWLKETNPSINWVTRELGFKAEGVEGVRTYSEPKSLKRTLHSRQQTPMHAPRGVRSPSVESVKAGPSKLAKKHLGVRFAEPGRKVRSSSAKAAFALHFSARELAAQIEAARQAEIKHHGFTILDVSEVADERR